MEKDEEAIFDVSAIAESINTVIFNGVPESVRTPVKKTRDELKNINWSTNKFAIQLKQAAKNQYEKLINSTKSKDETTGDRGAFQM